VFLSRHDTREQEIHSSREAAAADLAGEGTLERQTMNSSERGWRWPRETEGLRQLITAAERKRESERAATPGGIGFSLLAGRGAENDSADSYHRGYAHCCQ